METFKVEKIYQLEKMLKALANRNRLSIVSSLKQKKLQTVGEIAQEIELSFKGTSQHLQVLEAANIVNHRKEGNFVVYKLSRDRGVLKSIIESL